jgi:cation diffusion facilitator CzcD-associated flavoprotein CzcO
MKTDGYVDVVVIGAGFAGMYASYRARSAGLSVHGVEAGSEVGGTWYWNRYPGARCDVESVDYSFSFDEELEQEWTWSERFAAQPEILEYMRHVAKRFTLYDLFSFNQRVERAHYDDDSGLWHVGTDTGSQLTARFIVVATGSLSVPNKPAFPHRDDFTGEQYLTSAWPESAPDFTGKRVGLIGTGSSGIQIAPELAEQAAELTVFQRSANYSVPAAGGPLTPEELSAVKTNYAARRARTRRGLYGDPRRDLHLTSPLELTRDEREQVLEDRWDVGGVFFARIFPDQMVDEAVNEVVSDFARRKIRSIVTDPQTADDLTPTDHPFGSKRPCTDSGYFATFNLPHVHLVNLRRDPIVRFESDGIRTAEGMHQLDAIVYATGFDAFTGSLSRIDFRGRCGRDLQTDWADGPVTYLGVSIPGFPNLFLLNGPGSVGPLANMVLGAEQQIDWLFTLIAEMSRQKSRVVDVSNASAMDWTDIVDRTAAGTLFTKARSWYMGANIEGKKVRFMAYAGGLGAYVDRLQEEREAGFPGFEFAAR